LIVVAGFAFAAAQPAGEPPPNYRLSAPVVHENLTIFFLHGKDQIANKNVLTLDEALKQKKIIVHETKNVNQLSIENVSTDEVFIQAGDIVKGGQQDRIIALDMLVPPKSGKIPVGSFCVEQGRWSQRGGENVKQFGSSKDNIVGNKLKLAARVARDQGKVWKGVGDAQGMLKDKLKAEVQSKASSTSLALTLEHKKVLEAVEAYVKKLDGALDKQTDVIGYAVAINGKVNNADVYANAALFRKLWPKLLRCSAIEAVSEKKDKQKIEPVKAKAVTAFLADAAKGKKTEKKLVREQLEVQRDAKGNVLFETRAKNGAVLRRSYVGK
jgi:hypothetical protein